MILEEGAHAAPGAEDHQQDEAHRHRRQHQGQMHDAVQQGLAAKAARQEQGRGRGERQRHRHRHRGDFQAEKQRLTLIRREKRHEQKPILSSSHSRKAIA